MLAAARIKVPTGAPLGTAVWVSEPDPEITPLTVCVADEAYTKEPLFVIEPA